MKLHEKDALITIARNADKPVAFLVGAPLSEDSGGGVPGVSSMLALIRAEVNATDSLQLPRYDAALAGKADGDAYQFALDWLQGNFGQSAVNRVVKTAVFKARKATSPTSFEGDGAANDWHIPSGARQLAALVCAQRERFPGPILTTNFDPLLSLAIEENGGRTRLQVIQSDGGLAHNVKTVGVIDIVHLHGYWRDSDTLHTPTQLTLPRPQLKASLQQILKQRTLIVAAYGGWDDVFARALAEVVVDDASQVNVLWCFRDTEAWEVERKYQPLLDRVAPAITRGRFLAYGGIDCHSIFGEIGGFSSTTTATAAPAPTLVSASPLAGWEWIDSAYLNNLPSLRPEEVIRYFDGAVPTWRHAISTDIPRRKVVSEVAQRLETLRLAKDDCSIQLIRAAGGEGKTTLLLHIASDAARTGNWNVLWRSSSHVGLPPEHVVNLDVNKQWLIVADDAENLIDDLSTCAESLHQLGRSNVHFLLATRDADWWAKFGDRPPWETWLKAWVKPNRAIVLRGLVRDDAQSIIDAWTKYGANGLRELANLSGTSERVNALFDEVQDAVKEEETQMRRRKPVDGSFFGGLLTVRFGQDGLQAHVRSFLTRLKQEKIEDSKYSLFDALVYVAACHAVDIPGLNENVLADLVSVPREWVQSRVVGPLGEEATAASTASYVFTRHRKVAAAIIIEVETSLGKNLAEIWSVLVKTTVKTGQDIYFGDRSFPMTVHAGPRLQESLPKQFSEERRIEIAIAAAMASVNADKNRLSFIDSLSKTYRNAGNFADAIQVFRDNWPKAPSKVDFAQVIRAFVYEWGVSEGKVGDEPSHRAAGAWLQGLSLSDRLKSAPITPNDVKLICAGLCVAFGKLTQPRPDCPFARGRRAAAYLGRLITTTDPKALGYFDRADREANKIGTPHPQNLEEAIAWITSAVAHAGHKVQDPFLLATANPANISFNKLKSVLSKKKKSRR
ncbi:MAG TPA: SIR2 family protein [Pyrinomonadaceae bacterium]|jgi:hypothetical protein